MSNPYRLRALRMLHSGKVLVSTSTPGEYVVPSEGSSRLYRVTGVGVPDGFEACTCASFEDRLARCKHIWMVVLWREAEDADPAAPNPYPPIPRKQGKQINWSAYSKGRQAEYRFFHVLLKLLTATFPEIERNPTIGGRPPVPLRDQAFCAIQKRYLGFSYARSQGFRAEATARGQLERTPYWGVGSRFLCRPEVTPGLHALLALSAIPMIAFEKACAIDSTNLRTTLFHWYRKERYKVSRENKWLKMGALAGVDTHVIPVMEITEGTRNDYNFFRPLLEKAMASGFRFEEAYADKAFSGRSNFTAAAELGVEPYIPFKKNSTGKSMGSPIFHKFYLYFRYHRDEFDAHYRHRAQVESTFSQFKQKLTETIVSRTMTSQENEIICLGIAHNLTILVRQMFERGLRPEFGQNPLSAQGSVLEGSANELADLLGKLDPAEGGRR